LDGVQKPRSDTGDEASRPGSDQLVVIGSSAGGIEALSTLVATLPRDFPAPVVIAQHLDPNRASHLQEILARRSALPVRTVADQTALEPGVIFVVPANQHVELDGHQVGLSVDAKRRPKPSIDLLFDTAAAIFGEGLVAVVLTGTGSDGAAGARSVKGAGGTVVIQNPATASFPAMPGAIAPTVVDAVAELEEIGPLLHALITRTALPTDDALLQAVLAQVRERTGFDFSRYKLPTIKRRLQRRVVATGAPSLAGYRAYLERNPKEYDRLINNFLIKVTTFFRDPDLFAYLRDEALPGLLADARRRGDELRLWSAGCATGEEAYSLAILVAELFGDELERVAVRIFATDLDGAAVAFARRGVYPAAALEGVPPALRDRYFIGREGIYEVRKAVRALVVFGEHDLGQRAPFPRIDLVLCRGVLTFFTPALQRRTLQLFAFALREGGLLMLGKDETPGALLEFFAPAESQRPGQAPPGVYRRQGDSLPIPVARVRDLTPPPPQTLPSLPAHAFLSRRGGAGAERRPYVGDASPAYGRLGKLLLGLPLGVVVVDRRYDIQAINGSARRLLRIHGPAVGDDFIHLMDGRLPLAALRAAIDGAFAGALENLDEVAVESPSSGSGAAYLRIVCYPQAPDEGDEEAPVMPSLGASGRPGAVMITVDDVTRNVEGRRALEGRLVQREEENARTDARLRALADENQALATANDELARAIVELRSLAEEYQVNSEETQAATEEVETLNEELQASNEELETLNEELQASNEELDTANDDLQARSVELEDLAIEREEQRRASEAERERLAAVLDAMGDAVLVVDSSGRPTRANAAYERTFGASDAAVVPEDNEGNLLPATEAPWRRAARGESFSMSFTLPGADGARRWFEASGRPLSSGGAERGVVVVRDTTDRSLRRLQDEFLAMASHELRTPLTPIQGYLEMLVKLLAGRGDDVRGSRYASQALAQLGRLRALVDDLLDVGRLQNGKLRVELVPVDLAPLVVSAVEAARLEVKGQEILLRADPGPLRVRGDTVRLEQVVSNLLSNAVKHAPDSERIDVRLRRAGAEAVVEVQDYGPGIPAGALPHLFSRFYQVARDGRDTGGRGLGLGLFITREIVTSHGGAVDIASIEAAGATFTVRLPLLQDAD